MIQITAQQFLTIAFERATSPHSQSSQSRAERLHRVTALSPARERQTPKKKHRPNRAMASYGIALTGQFHMSIKITGLAEKTVRESLNELEELGVMKRIGPPNRRKYVLNQMYIKKGK